MRYIIRFLMDTRIVGVFLESCSGSSIQIYADPDYARNKDGRCSVTGSAVAEWGHFDSTHHYGS